MKLHSRNWLYNPLVGNFASWLIAGILIMPYANGVTDNFIFIILAVTIAPIWTIWLHAYRQAIKIEIKKKEINHTVSFIIRAIVAVFVGVIIHMIAEQRAPGSGIRGVIAALYMGAIFWATFDFFLNIHRGKPWDYIDKGKIAARSDRAFKERKVWWFTTKIVLLIFSLLLYIESFSWYL